MPETGTCTTSDVGLALRAIINHELRTFPIRDGMVIGRLPSCDIVVPQAGARELVIWLYGGDLRAIRYQDNPDTPTDSIRLTDGAMFAVGRTVFDVVRERPTEVSDESEAVTREACPRCRTNLLNRDAGVSFCPHCGAPLPADCPAWPMVNDDAKPQAASDTRWWMLWMPRWLRARVARDPLFFARRTTVLAYINTLFNLGLKYDAGIDADRQLPEAMRYYRKAAQLGNVPARARLKVKRARVLSPLPPGEG